MLRDHQKHDEFIGPRFLIYVAALEMHPLDTEDRIADLKDAHRHRLLQHHQVLHQGLPRAHHDHRQRDHPAQGARRRRVLRSGHAAAEDVPGLRPHSTPESTSTPESCRRRHVRAEAALEERGPGGAGQGRALPAAQRADAGGEHLRGRPARRAGQRGGARRADPGAVGPVRRRRADGRDGPGADAAARPADRVRARLLQRHPRRAPGAGAARAGRGQRRLLRLRGPPRGDGRGSRRPRPCVRPTTTTPSCAGTPAPAS